jgi:ATP-dependent exoDNAse (exonuclease V) beta subunit
MVPAISSVEEAWADDQRYEAMCVLYVALTRAKRGLYVLLPEVPKSRKEPEGWASMANWIAQSSGGSGEVLFQSGDPSWWREVPARQVATKSPVPCLAAAIPQRERTTPSGAKKEASGMVASPTGMAFGSAVHAAFEAVGWVDEGAPVLPTDDAGRLVGELLGMAEIRGSFERGVRNVELYREQAVEAILGGKWLSGIVDRLHVIRDGAGTVAEVEVIDFKTDAVETPEQLVERYAGQMEAYREVIARAFGGVPVRCCLLSTKLRRWVEVV